MYSIPPSSRRMFVWRSAIPILIAFVLVGCETYEPVPLDMHAYRASLDARLVSTEPISEFAQRLHPEHTNVPSHFDLDDGISYAEGEVLALFYNSDLRIARLEAGVALATRENAGLWEDPVFGFDGAEIISPPTPFEYGLMLSLTIPISGRLDVEKDRAGAAYTAQLRSVVDAEWNVRNKVREQWSEWTAALARRQLISDLIKQMDNLQTVIDDLEEAGELNRVERRLLRVELADRMAQISEVELKAVEAEFALLQLLGLPHEAAELLTPAFPDLVIPEIGDITDRLVDSNTELAVKFAEYQTAEETLRLEITKQLPDITIGSGYGTQFNDKRVMFGVSIPIPIFNANRAAIAEAAARREVARAEAETTYARLSRELLVAQTALESKKNQRNQYEQELVPLLTKQTEDLEKIAELGELDLFVMLETLTRTIEAKQRLIDLRVDEIEAAILLRRILGPDQLQAPSPISQTPPSTHPSVERKREVIAGGSK